MNYRHVYMLIIEHAKSEMKNGLRPKSKKQKAKFDRYFEMHHVLPRSLFPKWLHRSSNIVALTAREHFFCHQLLIKIFPCRQMYYAIGAFMFSSKTMELNRKLSSRDYAFCRASLSTAMKLRVGNLNSFYGKHHTDASKQKMSAWQKGKTMVEKLGIERAKEFSLKQSLNNTGCGNPMYKHVWTEESKRKIGDANRGSKNGFSKQVKNIISGETFGTMTECHLRYHIKTSKIRELLKSGSKYTTRLGEEVQFEIC